MIPPWWLYEDNNVTIFLRGKQTVKKNLLVIVIAVILGIVIGTTIRKDGTVPEETKTESEQNEIQSEGSKEATTLDLDIGQISNKKEKIESGTADNVDSSKISATADSPELYKEIVIENPYTLTEDTTFSVTWAPDSAPEYDTIGVTVYKYDYLKYKTIGRCDLIVNGKAYEASTDAGIISSIYVADLNVNDDMRNVLILENQESWNYILHIYAYKGTDLVKIGKVYGELRFESVAGDGNFETYYRRTWRAGSNDFIVFRYLHNVDASDYVLVQEQAGTLGNVNEGADTGFMEGYTVKINKDIPYYNDAECTQYAGTMKAGEQIDITGQTNGNLRIKHGDNEGWAIIQNYGPDDPDNDLEGYYFFC